jgi:hypothetical protein
MTTPLQRHIRSQGARHRSNIQRRNAELTKNQLALAQRRRARVQRTDPGNKHLLAAAKRKRIRNAQT